MYSIQIGWRKILVKEHFVDAALPRVLILRTQNDDIIYVNLGRYRKVVVDGKGFEKAKAEQAKSASKS